MIRFRQFSVALLFVAVAACGGAPATPSSSPAGSKPVVVVQQPTPGAVLVPGQNVVVSGAASDTVGIDRIALVVDGVAAGGTPPGSPAPLLPFSFNWLAVAGAHTVEVIAYRADGTASDPAIVEVTVGTAGTALPGTSMVTFAPLPTVPRPKPTRKPRRSRMPSIAPTAAAATATATASTVSTDTPTTTPTETPTTPPTSPPTIDPSGTAPDDTALEPHPIVLAAANPACPSGSPASAVGCVSEQISAPSGDLTDQLSFVPVANASYQLRLTGCSDQSGATVFHYLNPLYTAGCGQGFNLQMPATPPAQVIITVKFGTVSAQTYNAYQFTIYECAYFNCSTQ